MGERFWKRSRRAFEKALDRRWIPAVATTMRAVVGGLALVGCSGRSRLGRRIGYLGCQDVPEGVDSVHILKNALL